MREPSDGDQDPLAALKAGQPGPFEAFVASEAAHYMAFFQRLGAPRAEAEDLVQELFLKLFQQAETYERQGRFRPYVLRVARNAWIDRLRRRSIRRVEPGSDGRRDEDGEGALAIDWAPSREPDPATRADQQEQVRALRRAWSVLPEHHRLVFELGVLQERPYDEISEVLEIPVGTVKSRMFYALRKLRESAASHAPGGESGADGSRSRRSASGAAGGSTGGAQGRTGSRRAEVRE